MNGNKRIVDFPRTIFINQIMVINVLNIFLVNACWCFQHCFSCGWFRKLPLWWKISRLSIIRYNLYLDWCPKTLRPFVLVTIYFLPKFNFVFIKVAYIIFIEFRFDGSPPFSTVFFYEVKNVMFQCCNALTLIRETWKKKS